MAFLVALLVPVVSAAFGADAGPVTVTDLSLEGEIEGENIVFTLQFKADVRQKGVSLPLVAGDVAYLDGTIPKNSKLLREGGRYLLRFDSARKRSVVFRFAGRPMKDGDWRRAGFSIPMSSIRRLSVLCDRDDLEVQFPGALDVNREKLADGKARVTAFLGIVDLFQVCWKPEIRKFESELVVTCEANSIATASVGALRMDTVFTYRVIQGVLTRLVLALPEVNVTQVRGSDIQDWHIDKSDGKQAKLIVDLSRPMEEIYRLQVESEMALPKFPGEFGLPVLSPDDVIRTSGFLAIGTDSAIKLHIDKAAGLSQVDQASFPMVMLDEKSAQARLIPKRSMFAYQYASMPYTLNVKADDIVTSFIADDRLVLSLGDNELVFSASVELDVKDAPARELIMEIDKDPAWTVTSVTGEQVSEADTDVREEPDDEAGEGGRRRVICVPFKEAVSGVALIEVRMEKSLAEDAASFSAPFFKVRAAKSERGYLVAAAEKGLRLRVKEYSGLREVHTGSAPMRVADAQQAFRFKEPGWSISMDVERTVSSVHSEVFHLVSLGEGVMYSSAAITFHIGGAPVHQFRIRIPSDIETVEFTGADIEGWTREDDICTVKLQTKVMGDYTLLATHDRQFAYEGEDIAVGGIETIGTESEVGYIALASSASLKLEAAKPLPASIIEIDRDEIPSAYSAPVTDPIVGSYKYMRTPHTAVIRVEPYDTEQLLGQVADYVKLSTMLSKDGESVTTALYYIKNASRQYLIVSLPDGAELWSIKYVDENGTKRDALSQESADGILVPVRRPRDPNKALQVEIVCAQKHGKLGFWRSGMKGLRFTAPVLPHTHATFASWVMTIPEKFAVGRAGGNMTPAGKVQRAGLSGILAGAWRICAAIFDGWGGRSVLQAAIGSCHGQRVWEFTRTVNMSSGTPATLKLQIVPTWIGAGSSARMLVGAVVLGLLIAVFALAKKRGAGMLAVGLTVLLVGVAQSAAVRSLLSALLVLGVTVLLVRWLVRSGFKFIWKCARRLWGGPSGVLRRAWSAARAARERKHARKLELRMAMARDYGPPPFEVEGSPGQSDDRGAGTRKDGYVAVRSLAMTLAAGLLAAGCIMAGPRQKTAESEVTAARTAPVMDSIDVTIEGPGTDRDIEQSAKVVQVLEFQAGSPASFPVLQDAGVLTDCDLGSKHLIMTGGEQGYVLKVLRRGKYRVKLEFQVPVEEKEGQWTMDLMMLENLKNRVTLSIPERDMEIKAPDSVLFKTSDADDGTTVEAAFGHVTDARFVWRPRVRKTKLEEAVYFCQVNSLVTLEAGVVELMNLVRYQIAQGEIKELSLWIPESMSVTAVKARELATWSFDPESRQLDAVLEKPASGDFSLSFVTQVTCEGLPYSVTIGAPRVRDAARQRGAIALGAPDAVQVRVDDAVGVSPMNIGDFPSRAVLGDVSAAAPRLREVAIRRAFRYQQAKDVSVSVRADLVLPEIRVAETGILSIADERIVLATKLKFLVAKAGIFSVNLGIPGDFDVETLSGADVSHWDEQTQEAEAEGEGGKEVVVHFSRQIIGTSEIDLVVARMEKGIEERIVVPRVTVGDAKKHSGKLTISGERGVRMMVESHRGVDVKKASDEGIKQTGVLVFDLLRPDWSIVLKTEVLAPLVKPEVLHWIDLTEGMLQCRAFLRYKIENAGIKTFLVKSPLPDATLTITGRNVARVHRLEKDKATWQVDLHGKVENQFSMTVSYQGAYEHADQEVRILPVQTVDTEAQRGYLVVTCSGRVQVEPDVDTSEGLKTEDPRNIPVAFGAGDLSNAIQCYRTIRPDYELRLSVVRHDAASVLPASVEQVRMTSVVSTGGKLLTRAALRMKVGDLRFLKVALPHKDDRLWTVMVNGKEVPTSREEGCYYIPLEEQEGDQITVVDLVYADTLSSGRFFFEKKYEAPKFHLPLQDIEWSVFVPPGLEYYAFGGTMEPRELSGYSFKTFNAENYRLWNKAQRETALEKAKQVLDAGGKMARAGRQKSAKKAFQQALNYSQGQADLNEDARVQFRNLVKQQVKMGLVTRRDAVRFSKNIVDEQQREQIQGFRNGDYTQEYVDRVERRLSEKDKMALEIVANKMIDQQAAAGGVVTAISVTMPEHGRQLQFYRTLQIDPDGELNVTFKVGSGRVSGFLKALWPALLVFVVLWIWIGRTRGRREAPAM